jgi:Cyclin, N-terminal domain
VSKRQQERRETSERRFERRENARETVRMISDETDMALRAPVPRSLLDSIGSTADLHNLRMRTSLTKMLVACNILQVSMETQYTACCLWHRLNLILAASPTECYQYGTRATNRATRPPENFLWAACIFVACKVEEDHRRLRDIVNCANMLGDELTSNSNKLDFELTASPCSTILMLPFQPTPPRLEQAYWNSKEQMVTTEQYVLRWLSFDVVVSHPHRAVVILMTDLMEEGALRSTLLSRAWKLVNESIWDVALQGYSVMTLAAGIVTVVLEDYHLTTISTPWWRNYAVPDLDVKEVQEWLRQLIVPETNNTARQLQLQPNESIALSQSLFGM